MTRYVDGHPFPDDDSRSDAELREAIARSVQAEKGHAARRKREKRLAKIKEIPPVAPGTQVIAVGTGVIGGGKAHGTPIG